MNVTSKTMGPIGLNGLAMQAAHEVGVRLHNMRYVGKGIAFTLKTGEPSCGPSTPWSRMRRFGRHSLPTRTPSTSRITIRAPGTAHRASLIAASRRMLGHTRTRALAMKGASNEPNQKADSACPGEG